MGIILRSCQRQRSISGTGASQMRPGSWPDLERARVRMPILPAVSVHFDTRICLLTCIKAGPSHSDDGDLTYQWTHCVEAPSCRERFSDPSL